MTAEELNILHKKAETRKDGIYSFRGNLWVVKSNKFIAFVNPKGEVLRRCGAFNQVIGSLWGIERYEWKNKLKELLK